MSSFIFLEADGFAARAKARAKNAGANRGKELPGKHSSVRRPYRGIQIKDDTYATISVVKPGGAYIALTSSSARVTKHHDITAQGKVNDYSDFILQNITDQRAEKQQVIETFGEPFIYFYGERPRTVSFSGMLVNSEDFNWRAQFWENYENHLRGTKLVQENARVYLTYDTILLEGYPISASAQDTSDSPYAIPFQMQMFVTAYYNFSEIGKTRFPGKDDLVGLDVMNKKLESRRKGFVSTTLAVRQANLDAQGPKGIAAEMRKGIRGLNNLANMAGDYLAKASQVIGGRVVRVPVGVASYLESVGTPTYAAGSVSTADGTITRYDFKTGKLESVSGSVKIRAPATATFAPAWVSGVDGRHRGFFWENVDEYPARKQPQRIIDMLTDAQYGDLFGRLRERALRKGDYQASLDARVLELVGDGPGMLETMASAVSFAKSAYGMAASAVAVVGTGVTIGRQVAGIVSREGERIKNFVDKQGRTEVPVSNHIGSAALDSFSGKKDALSASGGEAALGESYDQAAYTGGYTGGDDANYENTYGESNYDGMVTRNAGTKKTLTEASGDSDVAPEGSEVDLETLKDVYGSGSAIPINPDATGQAENAQQVQNNAEIVTSEDTRGIRSVDADDARIDAII
jgi:hypothetical protein